MHVVYAQIREHGQGTFSFPVKVKAVVLLSIKVFTIYSSHLIVPTQLLHSAT